MRTAVSKKKKKKSMWNIYSCMYICKQYCQVYVQFWISSSSCTCFLSSHFSTTSLFLWLLIWVTHLFQFLLMSVSCVFKPGVIFVTHGCFLLWSPTCSFVEFLIKDCFCWILLRCAISTTTVRDKYGLIWQLYTKQLTVHPSYTF